MTRVKECVLYRGFEHGEILDKMTALMDACEKSAVNAKEMEEDFYECVNGLIETAGSYGFAGNLWHNYLTLLLVNNENAFSTASEIRGQWREALTIWLFMILEFSKNFMTLILLFLTVRLEQTVLIFSVIM